MGISPTTSLGEKSLAPGFYLLATLETESLSIKGCKEGSVKLMDANIYDPMVTTMKVQTRVYIYVRVRESFGC